MIGARYGKFLNKLGGSVLQNPRATRIGCFALVLILGLFVGNLAFAQSLNWDGQTGGLITPFAYTAASPANGIGHPIASFHFLNGGPQIGNMFQVSGTVGLFKKLEVGYSRTITSEGDGALSAVFNTGYNTFHVKSNIVPENAMKMKFMPAISVGFVARTNDAHGASMGTVTDNNFDIYLVGTKTVTQVKHLPFLLSAGIKGTNASILGIAGNAPDWQARGFGAAGIVLNGPAKSKFVVGSEVLQESKYLKNLNAPGDPVVPTTLNYFARVLPMPEKPLNLDFAVLQAGGKTPLGDLQARTRFAFGISYKF